MIVRCQGTGITVTLGNVTSPPLPEVLGANCKRIRTAAGLTQDELARYARTFGLRWNAAKVGDFEAGRSAPTFATVLVVSKALHFAVRNAAARSGDLGVSVRLSELLRGDGEVRLNDESALPAALLAGVCEGQSWSMAPWHIEASTPGLETKSSAAFDVELYGDRGLSAIGRILLRSGLTEERLARRLGIELERLSDISHLLWGSTFSDERDRRAGPDANQQKKGRVSRELRAELERELANGDD